MSQSPHTNRTKTAAIILAAGESRRMGTPKASLPFRGGTFLSVLASTFSAFCRPVIAVFGYEGDRLALQAPAGVLPAINPDYALGMLTSLQAGLRTLASLGDFDRLFFTLVDHPAVTAATLGKLLTSDAPIVIPRSNGKRGHPVLIDAEIARQFLAAPLSAKVRDTIDRNASVIHYLDVEDTSIHDDIDDPALYRALLARDGGTS